MTLHGTVLVARQELRARLRAGRWRWLFGLCFAGAVAALAWAGRLEKRPPPGLRGVPMFGALVLFLLTFVLLAAPGLTARSINGDRSRGTLAVLLVTRLSPAEIAAGKLASAWLTAATALAVTVPAAAWCVLAGGVTAARVAGTYAVIAVLAGVLCAVGEVLSALIHRPAAAVLLAYAVVATLTFGTLAGFGLVSGPASPGASPQRPDRTWWLLAPNPYVIAADAAPGPGAAQPSGPVLVRPRILVLGGGRCAIPGNDACAGRTRGRPARVTPHVYRLPEGGPLFADAKPLPRPSAADSLSAISRAARDARGGHGARPGVNQAPVWPYGLGFYVLLGAASLWCAAACLRAPARKLRPGTGIA